MSFAHRLSTITFVLESLTNSTGSLRRGRDNADCSLVLKTSFTNIGGTQTLYGIGSFRDEEFAN